jgi:hypothetical protein
MKDDGLISKMCALHAADLTEVGLTETERRFLAESEPAARLRPVEVGGMSQGRQSRVSVLAYGEDDEQHYVVWKRMGAGKYLTRDEATKMWERLGRYKGALDSLGWVTPAQYHSTVVDVSHTESQIFSYEQFVPGGDGDAMLADPDQPNLRKWHFVTEVLRVLYSYPAHCLDRKRIAGRTLTALPVGMDVKAANFVLERGSNRLYFIDLFGPKELDRKGRWLLYSPKIDTLPEENLRAVCATREGCVLRFWRLARRLWEPDRERRQSLTEGFFNQLLALDPPRDEVALIREEIDARFPWLTQLYSEREV